MPNEPKLTGVEKLILLMLCDIHEHLKIENSIDPKVVRSAIDSGNTWALPIKYPGIFESDEIDANIAHEVEKILLMWRTLESSYANLTPRDRSLVAKQVGLKTNDLRFIGFDGNNEGEYLSAARFWVKEFKDTFPEFEGRDLNSHLRMVGKYQAMLPIFEKHQPRLGTDNLTADQIVRVLRADDTDVPLAASSAVN